MTFDSTRDDEAFDRDHDERSHDSIVIKVRPAVWPVFVTYVFALIAIVVLQVIVIAGMVVWQLVNGANLQQLANNLMDEVANPIPFMILASTSQFAMAAAGLVAAWLSRNGISATLGLGKPVLPLWAYPMVIVGALAPAVFGLVMAEGLNQLMPQDKTFEILIDRMTFGLAVPFILFISLVPGFVEEVFFRGYMQRRLLQRWSPWAAIVVTSALFAVLHIDPHQTLFAFPIGLWFGVIAWRTGSIWPCMLCHAFINGTSMGWAIGERLLGFPQNPPLIPSAIVGVLVLGCFIVSVWLLARQRPAALPGAADESPQRDRGEQSDEHVTPDRGYERYRQAPDDDPNE